jgi:hypothetical protein
MLVKKVLLYTVFLPLVAGVVAVKQFEHYRVHKYVKKNHA